MFVHDHAAVDAALREAQELRMHLLAHVLLDMYLEDGVPIGRWEVYRAMLALAQAIVLREPGLREVNAQALVDGETAFHVLAALDMRLAGHYDEAMRHLELAEGA